MSNHNNIYNILGKLQALEPKQETPKQEAKPIYESVEARGSVLEGITASLSEKYMGFKKTVAAIKKGGSAENPEAVAAAIGRKKYGKAKFQKAAAAGKKMGEGEVQEVAAPGQEDWIKKNKQHFIDQYGKDKGMSVLYATAWKRHHKANESVAEGEETCNECGMLESECGCDHVAEGEVTKTEKGIKHKGSYGTEYQGDTDDEEEDQKKMDKGTKGRGRPSKGGAKKAKPTGEKKGRGRPKKADSEKSQAHLPWGGKPPKASDYKLPAWPKEKTRVHKMDEGMSKLAERFLAEGVNLKRMMEEQSMSLEEMIGCLSKDLAQYKESGKMTEMLRDCMEVFSHAKKQLADEGVEGIPGNLPAGQVPGKQALLKTPTSTVGKISGAVKDTLGGLKDFVTGKPEDPTRPTYEASLEEELNELARLAGLNVAEGVDKEKFAALAEPKDKITYADKIAGAKKSQTDEEVADEGNAFTGKLKDTPKGGEFELDGKTFTDTSNVDECGEMPSNPEDNLNVDVHMDNNGHKNVTVSASGEQAKALMQMLKLAGIGSDSGEEGNSPEAVIVSDEGMEEAVDVKEPAEEPANAPEEDYYTIKGSTLTPGEGDNGEKQMNPDRPTWKNGDNAMARPPVRESNLELETRLAAEYESIKKVTK